MNVSLRFLLLLMVLLPATVALAPGSDAATLKQLYTDSAAKIIDRAKQDDGAWNKLEHLCDWIGHRLSGSPELVKATQWAAETMREES